MTFNIKFLAIEIMSTFIHNEPTCLNILQEAKLPQMFLETVNKGVLVSAEVCFIQNLDFI